MKKIIISIVFLLTGLNYLDGQNFTEILGRPAPGSVTMSILSDQHAEVYWEYGPQPGSGETVTEKVLIRKDTAKEVTFAGLHPDTRYYYRTRFRPAGSGAAFNTGPEHTFHTQRARGSSFSFAVEADPHLDTNSNTAAYSLTLQNILSAGPDFMFDLGDTFMSEKLKVKSQPEITLRHLLYRSYFGSVCHSVPLYLVLGNHEGENGWIMTGCPGCLPVMAANTRKLYYPNPVPDSFYSGNSVSEDYVGLRQNYYAWEWGNALFVVLDPYWYTAAKPEWGWTLGQEQYNWFKEEITGSQAGFKFVFCHQLVGGNGNDARGGAEYAHLYEMGGLNTDSSRGFEVHRPGWGKSIHELMAENHVSVFFHGHDHCYAKQELDGVIYQEVPQPSSKNISNFTGTPYGYVNGVLLPGRGYLRVDVSDSTARVDYIRTFLPHEATGGHLNGEVADSYTLRAGHPSGQAENDAVSSADLLQNYPNPFHAETIISCTISAHSHIQVKIFDMFGKELKTLADEEKFPGRYAWTFHVPESPGKGGIYFCRMIAGNHTKTLKMICIP